MNAQNSEYTAPSWIKTPYNAKSFPKYKEQPYGVSVTIPDQSMSLKELLDRYARGIPIEGEKFPIYHGEEEMPDLRRLDLSEIADLRESVSEQIKEQNEALIKDQLAKDKEAADLKRQQEIEKAIEDYEKAKKPKKGSDLEK